MTAAGMWAGLLGGRAVLGLPLAFLNAMLVGVTLALAGIEVPAVEIAIATSVLALGTAIALRLRLPQRVLLAASLASLMGMPMLLRSGRARAHCPSL
jgi:urease accessory protein